MKLEITALESILLTNAIARMIRELEDELMIEASAQPRMVQRALDIQALDRLRQRLREMGFERSAGTFAMNKRPSHDA